MRKESRDFERQRRGLLAKVHIAKKDLGLDDGTYRLILRDGFGVTSSRVLSTRELERLVKYFKSKGWVPSKKRETKESQIIRLRHRIREMAGELALDRKRLVGLTRFTCKVDDPAWCRDPEKLGRLLAVLGKLSKEAHS